MKPTTIQTMKLLLTLLLWIWQIRYCNAVLLHFTAHNKCSLWQSFIIFDIVQYRADISFLHFSPGLVQSKSVWSNAGCIRLLFTTEHNITYSCHYRETKVSWKGTIRYWHWIPQILVLVSVPVTMIKPLKPIYNWSVYPLKFPFKLTV